MHAMRRRSWVLGGLVAAVVGCSTADTTHEGAGSQPSETVTATGLQAPNIPSFRATDKLDAEVRQKVAFKASANGFAGGFLAYDSAVSELGEVSFTAHPLLRPGQSAAQRRRPWLRPTAVQGSPVRLSTQSIRRTGVELAEGQLSVREDKGAVVVERGMIQEIVENTDLGLEQSWQFGQLPDGTGDLIVEVQQSGGSFVATMEQGLHFVDAAGVDFVYSHAVWTDSKGARTTVPVRWDGQRITMSVPREVVESAAYPASLDPLTSPLTTSTYAPDVASNGATDIAAWESYSSGTPRIQFSFINDSDGSIGSVFNKNASATASTQTAPSVAYDGTDFVAVWNDTRSGTANIRFSRINTSTGAVSGEFAVATSSNAQYSPRISCVSATNCLVAWHEVVGGFAEIRGAIVNANAGTAGSVIQISGNSGEDQIGASVANNGTNYFVGWEASVFGQSDVSGRNVTGAGANSGPIVSVATGSDDQYSASVGYNGTNYVVGYTDFATDEDLYIQLVTPGAGVSGSAVAFATGTGIQDQISLAKNGTTLLGTYYSAGDIAAKTLSGTTASSPFTIANSANDEDGARAAHGTTNWYVVYNNNYPDVSGSKDRRVYGARTSDTALLSSTGELRVGPPRCDVLTATASPASTTTVGTTVTVTGTATCTTGQTAEYEFWINPGSGYTKVQAYSATNTYAWNTTGLSNGTYTILVRTRRVGSTAVEDADQTISYTLTGGAPSCNSVTASASPASPQVAGAAVNVTGAATCTSGGVPLYQFWLNSGAGYTLVKDYSTSATWAWNTTGASAATYSVLVRAKGSTSTAALDSQAIISYTLTGGAPACNTLSVTPSPASPAASGTTVNVTGNATCVGGGTPTYQFWLDYGTGYQIVQDFSASATWAWNTTTYAGNTYHLLVRSRANGTTTLQGQVTLNYTVTGNGGLCNTLTASASPTSPRTVGTTVTITGNATCTNGATPRYQFWTTKSGGSYVLRQDFGASNQFIWNTTGLTSGDYTVLVRSKSTTSSFALDAQTTVAYHLN